MTRISWYRDAALVACLPRRFRVLAWYFRLAARSDGRVPGGSFLFRRTRNLTRLFRLRDAAPVRAGGHDLWVDLTDQRMLTVLDEVRQEGGEWPVLRTLLTPGATFVDIGANHGSYAIRAATLVGREGRVIAVEPNARLAELVRRSLAASGTPYAVHAVALGSENRAAVLHVPADASGSASLYREYGSGDRRKQTVRVTTADRLLDGIPAGRPCVIKLDVEGAEADVLRGARDVLGRMRPVILWELNPDSAAAAGGVDALFAEFARAGYHRFAELDGWPGTVAAAAVARTPQRNLLAVPLS